MRRSIICLIGLLLVALLLAACGAAAAGPMTWLDRPLDGAVLPLEPVTIQAHASDADGVGSFEFFVDDALLVTVPAAGGLLEEATAGWIPTEPGTYTIRARGVDSQGSVGSEGSSVVVVGELAEPTPSPTYAAPPVGPPSSPMPPTLMPVPPTATVVPMTGTPLPPTSTPTTPPLPPTSTPTTPPPPTIVSFQANPSSILEGECTTLSWAVEGALTGVWLDGEGAGDHDSRDRCPDATTTYTLVTRSPGGEDQASVTVTVTEAPTPTPTVPPLDTTPPDIVNPQAEPDEILKEGPGCPAYSRTTTVSATVTDAGGVASVVARWNLVSDSEEVAMTFSGGDVYEAVLGPFNSTGQLLIVIVAWDQAGNTAQVGPLTVQVDQCIT